MFLRNAGTNRPNHTTCFFLINVCFVECLYNQRGQISNSSAVSRKVWKGDNAMMMKINDISDTWERNKTKASTEGGEDGKISSPPVHFQ
jgi:hypothetical protein